MTVARSPILFVAAALAEIGGPWLVWRGVREHRGWLWAGVGVIALGVDGFVATLQPDPNFGRIPAAYGGVFVAGSLAWGMAVDGFRPDRLRHRRRARVPRGRRRDHARPTRRLSSSHR
jgi:small multidrug resistance family-3 protein